MEENHIEEEHMEEPSAEQKIEILKGVIEKQEVRLKKVELKLTSLRIIVWVGVSLFVFAPYLKRIFGQFYVVDRIQKGDEN